MKVRVLYPPAFAELEKPPAGGDVIDLDAAQASAFIDAGYAEAHDAKPAVEQATAAPGEKRRPGRPRKNP